MNNEQFEMSLEVYQNIYKKKWSGLILKEQCDECNSKNIMIYDSEGDTKEYPIEAYPHSKCMDCGNMMIHSHYCHICGKDTIHDCFLCHRHSKKEREKYKKSFGKKYLIKGN